MAAEQMRLGTAGQMDNETIASRVDECMQVHMHDGNSSRLRGHEQSCGPARPSMKHPRI